MIRVEYLSAQTSPVARVGSSRNLTQGDQYPTPSDLVLLVSAYSPPICNTEEVDLGHLTQGTTWTGPLREKDVKHYNVDAELSVELSRNVGDPVNGMQCLTTSTGQKYYYDQKIWWGEQADLSKVGTYHSWVGSDGATYTADPRVLRAYTRYSGDSKLVVVNEWTRGATYRNGTLYGPLYKEGRMSCFRRSGSSLYLTSATTKTTGWYTESEVLAALGAIPSTGGTLASTYVPVVTQLASQEVAHDVIFTDLRRWAPGVKVGLETHPTDFGDLALECAQQLRVVDPDVLGLVFDVADWRSFLQQWKNFAAWPTWKTAWRKFKVGHASSPALGRDRQLAATVLPASAYLSTKYGVLPGVSDLRRLYAGVSRFARFFEQQRLHSRRVSYLDDPNCLAWSHTAVITVQCAKFPTHITQWLSDEYLISDATMQLVGGLIRSGLYPRRKLAWDRIPFSFVLDWCVKFSDFFEDVDNWEMLANYFPISFCVLSEKWSKEFSSTQLWPTLSVTGVVKFTYYTRWVSRELPTSTVSLTTESPTGKHWLESTALVVQRLPSMVSALSGLRSSR